jgi:hypothetical protein
MSAPNRSAMTLARASLTEKANPAKRLVFHFNPNKISFQRSAQYNPTPAPAKSEPTMQYKGSGTSKLSLELLFDAVEKQPTGSVLSEIDKLLKWTRPVEKDDPPRPPILRFNWGALRIADSTAFECVLTDVDVTYRMFSRSGLPIRADVKITLVATTDNKASAGSLPQKDTGAQNPTSGGDSAYRRHVVRGGESLSALAFRYYGEAARWRGLAAANRIDDPLRLRPGTALLVPAAGDLPKPE